MSAARAVPDRERPSPELARARDLVAAVLAVAAALVAFDGLWRAGNHPAPPPWIAAVPLTVALAMALLGRRGHRLALLPLIALSGFAALAAHGAADDPVLAVLCLAASFGGLAVGGWLGHGLPGMLLTPLSAAVLMITGAIAGVAAVTHAHPLGPTLQAAPWLLPALGLAPGVLLMVAATGRLDAAPAAGWRREDIPCIVLGALTTGIGVVALAGWLLRSALLVQGGTAYVPVVFSTAVSLTAIGAAWLSVLIGRRSAGRVLVVPVIVLSGSALLVQVGALDGGLDARLWKHAFIAEGAMPGRMATLTAITLMIASIAIAVATVSARRRPVWAVVWTAGLLIFVVGAVATVGLLTDTVALRGGRSQPIALLTTFGLMLLGASMLVRARERGADRRRRGALLPAVAAIVALLFSIGAYQSLKLRREAELAETAHASALLGQQAIDRFLSYRLRALERAAARLAALPTDERAGFFRTDLVLVGETVPGMRDSTLVDADLRPIAAVEGIAVARGAEPAFTDADLQTLAARATALGAVQISELRAVPGAAEGTLLAVAPLPDGSGFVTATIRSGPLFATVLATTAPEYGIVVRLDDATAYARGTPPASRPEWPVAAAVTTTLDHEWTIRAWLRNDPQQDPDTRLPETILFAGLLGGALLALALRLHAVAQLRAERAESAIVALEAATRAREASESALHVSRRELAEILENMTDAFLLVDRDWRFTYLNPRAERLVRRPAASLLGRSLWDEFPPTDTRIFTREFMRAVETREPAAFETWYPPLGIWMDVRALPHEGGLAIYVRDVTARRRDEEQLRRSEAMLLRAQRIARLGTWEREIDSGALHWSAETLAIFGIDAAAFGGDFGQFMERVHPDDRARLQAAQERMRSGEADLDIQYRIVRPNGELRFVEELGTLVRDADGRPVTVSGTVQDVTERVLAEERLRTVIEASPSAMIVVDLDGAIRSVNGQTEALFGYARDALIGAPVEILLPESRRTAHRGLRLAYLRTPTTRRMGSGEPLPGRRRDGTEVPLEIGLSPFRTHEGEFVLVSAIDISVRLRAESALREALADAQRRARQLAALNRAAVAASRGPDDVGVLREMAEGACIGVSVAHAAFVVRPEDGTWGESHALEVDAAAVQEGAGLPPWCPAALADGVIAGGRPRRALGADPVDPARPMQLLVVPLRAPRGAAIGVLALGDMRAAPFAEEDEELAEAFAQIAAIAVQRARLIADLRATQLRLEEQLAFSRAVQSSLGEGVYAVDRSGLLLLVNPVAEALLGWGMSASAIDDFERRLLPDDAPAEMRPSGRVLAEGGPILNVEAVFRARDGAPIDVAWTGSPLVVEGRVLGAVIVFRDLREFKRATAAMRERDRYFELSQDIICIARNKRFVQVNDALTRVLGLSREALLTTDYAAFVHPDDLAATDQCAEDALTGQPVIAFRNRYRHADGGWRWLEWTTSTDADGTVYGVARDITEKLAAETALQRAFETLQERNRELQEFAFVASHDLREPLRKVQAFGDLLVERAGPALDAQARDYLDRMQGAARRMQQLIEDLLAYSRVTTKALPFRRVALDTVAREVLSDLETAVARSKARVAVGTLPEIEADPTQMRQLLQNLIANAIKFHAPGVPPEVEVEAEIYHDIEAGRESPWCRLQVRDHGIGFDPRYAERLFQPFQRLHGRREYEGTGIGLAIVKKIVDRHGGRVRAEGRPGLGTTVVVELPAHATPRTSVLSRENAP